MTQSREKILQLAETPWRQKKTEQQNNVKDTTADLKTRRERNEIIYRINNNNNNNNTSCKLLTTHYSDYCQDAFRSKLRRTLAYKSSRFDSVPEQTANSSACKIMPVSAKTFLSSFLVV